MDANSSPVHGQLAPRFEALERSLNRHRGRWTAPITELQRRVFANARGHFESAPIVIDAGCGTGRSTVRLCAEHPRASVLGIDRSAARLQKAPSHPRAAFVRANLEPFFAQLREAASPAELAAGARPCSHCYILYPNPSPKPGQQSRRLYARPGFADLLGCSEHIEMRTNWEIYAQEFAHAIRYLSDREVDVEPMPAPAPAETLSDFERKYIASGHDLWRVRA